MTTRRKYRSLYIRDVDGELLDLLDQRVAIERRNGRDTNRTAMVREILRTTVRWLRRPVDE